MEQIDMRFKINQFMSGSMKFANIADLRLFVDEIKPYLEESERIQAGHMCDKYMIQLHSQQELALRES